jgi:hypothetical protein
MEKGEDVGPNNHAYVLAANTAGTSLTLNTIQSNMVARSSNSSEGILFQFYAVEVSPFTPRGDNSEVLARPVVTQRY